MFGSTEYANAFKNLPKEVEIDVKRLRENTVSYLDKSFNPQTWYDDPVCSILNGQNLYSTTTDSSPPTNSLNGKDDNHNTNPHIIQTTNAMGQPNGIQHLATPPQITQIKQFIIQLQLLQQQEEDEQCYKDLRTPFRNIEKQLLNIDTYAPILISNQCHDFQKQDGVTEIEEASSCNIIEQRLNDILLCHEQQEVQLQNNNAHPTIQIRRKPIYVSCVSNFTNFLDLFRKTIRSLELGIPCIIIGRYQNTTQHSFRWVQILLSLMKQQNLNLNLLTYISCTVADLQTILSDCQPHTGRLYATCSRQLAKQIKSSYAPTITSTGGPNTFIATEWTPSVQDAIGMSSTIEHSGQCTALRHLIVPQHVAERDVHSLFQHTNVCKDAVESFRLGHFADLLLLRKCDDQKSCAAKDYTRHEDLDVYYKITDCDLPNDDIPEFWRNVVLDVTKMTLVGHNDNQGCNTSPSSTTKILNYENIKLISQWLIRNQPISLAINTPRFYPQRQINNNDHNSNNAQQQQHWNDWDHLGKVLFENTSLVVYTLGSTDCDDTPPAMTCQARPQEGEIFGEVPPRHILGSYTTYPMIVPSSNPSYDSSYNHEYLKSLSVNDDLKFSLFLSKCSGNNNSHHEENKRSKSNIMECIISTLDKMDNLTSRGYCIELLNYLYDATKENPKKGFGTGRTSLWGIMRPPLNNIHDTSDEKRKDLSNVTCIRCHKDATLNDLMPFVFPFLATNAKHQFQLSLHPDLTKNGTALFFQHVKDIIYTIKLPDIIGVAIEYDDIEDILVVEDEETFQNRKQGINVYGNDSNDSTDTITFWNIIEITRDIMKDEYPLVAQFVSLLFTFGHVKSTMKNDVEFIDHFSSSEKWLQFA